LYFFVVAATLSSLYWMNDALAAYIVEVKMNLRLPMYDDPNTVEELKQLRKHIPKEKVKAIKDALNYFNLYCSNEK